MYRGANAANIYYFNTVQKGKLGTMDGTDGGDRWNSIGSDFLC